MRVRLLDLPIIPAIRFRYDNSVCWHRIPPPAFWDTANGIIRLEPEFSLVGYCLRLPDAVLRASQVADEQLGLMMFSQRYGEIWEHYPWYDDDCLRSMVFEGETR